MARTAHTLVQLVGTLAVVSGTFLLFGVPWALLLGGLVAVIASVTTEAASALGIGQRRDAAGDR